MPSWLVLALVVTAGQANPDRPKPGIIHMKFGLAGQTFTGKAAGWPFRPGHWNWLTAAVLNPLDRDLDAALTFHTESPQATGRFHLTKAFRLPGQSVLRVSFPVRSSTPKVPGTQPSYGVLELKVDGAVIDEKRAVISSLDDNVYAIGVLGESNGLNRALDGKSLYPNRGPELQSPGIVRTVVLADDQMPEDPLGLDFLHTLIVVHPGNHELRPGQWAAIDDWVQAGGNIVFVLGSDPAAHEVPDVRPMLPAYSAGTRRVTVLPSLAEWSGGPLQFDDGVVLAEMVTSSGRVIARDGQDPLLVQAQRGSGTASCVALNVEPGLAAVPAYQRFWMEVLRSLHQPRAMDTARLEQSVNSIVEQFAGRPVVGMWLPMAIIGAYFTVVGLLVRGAKGSKAGEARWIGICAAAIAFTVAGHAMVWAMSPAPARGVYDIWVASGTSPSQTLRITDYLSTLPAARGDNTVHIKNRQVQVVPTHETGASVVDAAVHFQGPSVRFQAEQARLRTVHLEGQLAVPGLSVRAKTGPDAVVVELENQTPHDLDKSFFKLGRRVLPVGPLARGERKAIDIRPATVLAGDDRYESDQLLDSAGRLRHSILGALFVDPATQSDDDILVKVHRGSEQGTSSGSLFAGWINRSLLDVSWGEGDGAATSRALGLVAIEPQWEIGDTTFLVPRGAMSLRLTEPGARQYYFGKSVFRGEHPVSASLKIEFAVPPWARPAEIEQATLFVQFAAEAYRLQVFLGDERLPLPEVPSGRFALPASVIASQGADQLRFRLVVEPRAEFASDLGRQGHRWVLREFDVECLCRRSAEEHD